MADSIDKITSDVTDKPETETTEVVESNPETEKSVEAARDFITQEVPYLGRLTGLEVDVEVGQGWTTDLETGEITVDPKFFVDKGYTTEESVYATLHELWAHVRQVIRDPQIAARQISFAKKGSAEKIFNNIFADIYGNKLMHYALPAMADVGEELYEEKLFPMTEKDGTPSDYTKLPLHLQFLYTIIRDEMIPGSTTPVRPEVSDAIARLRQYKGAGDIIKYLTDPQSKLTSSERFDRHLAIIYPEYLKLLQQSREERKKNKQQSGEGDEDGEGEKGDDPFQDDYDDYFENKAPQPIDEEDMEKTRKKAQKQQSKSKKPVDNQSELDKQLRKETGFSLRDHNDYKAEVSKNLDSINRMRDVFKSIIAERVAAVRGLSRRAYSEGDILDPNRLAQAVTDVKSGVSDPEAFLQYETKKGSNEVFGSTDYIFAFDRSGSMDGTDKNEVVKSKSAATCALIMLEALAGVQRDIDQAEADNDLDLDLDIRTALYVFDSTSTCIKPLGTKLSSSERLKANKEIVNTQGSTGDYITLQEIANIPQEPGRRRVVIIISDGESDNTSAAKSAVAKLRREGVLVYGIGIGSDAATELYEPNGKRVDEASKLPDVMQVFIEDTIR